MVNMQEIHPILWRVSEELFHATPKHLFDKDGTQYWDVAIDTGLDPIVVRVQVTESETASTYLLADCTPNPYCDTMKGAQLAMFAIEEVHTALVEMGLTLQRGLGL